MTTQRIMKAQDQTGRPGYMYRGVFLRKANNGQWIAIGKDICREFGSRKSAIRAIEDNFVHDAIESIGK